MAETKPETCPTCDATVGECQTCEKCDSHTADGVCYECDVCPTCTFTKPNCECGQFGHSKNTPWEDRGHHPDIFTKRSDWQTVWPEIDTSVDPIEAAASFYLLEAMTGGVLHPVPGLHLEPIQANDDADEKFFSLFTVEDEKTRAALRAKRDKRLNERIETDPVYHLKYIMGQAESEFHALVEHLDVVLVAYSHMAIAGELRHHKAFQELLGGVDRPVAWCAWRNIHATVGHEALADAATMFYQFSESGYGGPPWANCAETLYGRLMGTLGPDGPDGIINRRMFIDRFWTLEHNGGCFLNKINWSQANSKGWGLSHMKTLLDAHGQNPVDTMTLLRVAAPNVQAMYSQYLSAVNGVLGSRKLALIEDVTAKMLLKVKVCQGCRSDVTKGHFKTCSIMDNKTGWSFNPKDITKKDHTAWFGTFTWDVIEEHGWAATVQKSVDEELPWNSEGKMAIDGNKEVTVTFAGTVMNTKSKTTNFEHKTKATFNDIVNGKVNITPKDHIDTDDVYEYWWNLHVSNGGVTLVTAADGAWDSPGTPKNKKPENWLNKPIDLAHFVTEKGDWTIT